MTTLTDTWTTILIPADTKVTTRINGFYADIDLGTAATLREHLDLSFVTGREVYAEIEWTDTDPDGGGHEMVTLVAFHPGYASFIDRARHITYRWCEHHSGDGTDVPGVYECEDCGHHFTLDERGR